MQKEGAVMHRGSVHASNSAAQGSNPGTANILLASSWTVQRDQTHLVLKQGISRMQLAAKVWDKYYKKQ